MLVVVARRVAAGICLASAASLAVAGCGGPSTSSPPSSHPSVASCSLLTVAPFSGAPTSLGLDAAGAAVPSWSAEIGRLSVVEDGTAFGIVDGSQSQSACVIAVDVATGKLDWASGPPSGHLELFGATADSSTVLAAAGVMVGHAPAMVFGAVDDLIAYNPVTGEPMWSFGFPDDGQGMPALLAGGTVVVSEADGSVVGLSESDGRQLWRNPPPAGCASSGMQDLQPNAAGIGVMPGSAPGSPIDAVIGYRCPAGGSVVQIDPSDGVAAWKWPVPEGWTLDPQMASTVNTGSALGYVPVVPISLAAPANAPPVTAPAPGPTRRTAIDNVYGYSQSNDVVVLNPATAQPLWDLENVVGLGLSVVGGAGSLCVLTDAGGDCRDALTGVSLWSTQWPGVHASSRYPALNCVDMVVMAQRCAVSAGGLLYLALATDAAPGDANPPGRPESGIFVLTELNMATGASVASLPLPAFNPGPDGIGVCLVGPPAVLLVADGLALVSPQFEETDVIEAFALPASG